MPIRPVAAMHLANALLRGLPGVEDTYITLAAKLILQYVAVDENEARTEQPFVINLEAEETAQRR